MCKSQMIDSLGALTLMTHHKRINQCKIVALVAHDNMKQPLLQWVQKHVLVLAQHKLLGTATTAELMEKETTLRVGKLASGPLGGDQQIGGRIAEGQIDVLIFFWDPLSQLPHNDDVKALLRVAALWNIPTACNQASAEYLISSYYFSQEYIRYPTLTTDLELDFSKDDIKLKDGLVNKWRRRYFFGS